MEIFYIFLPRISFIYLVEFEKDKIWPEIFGIQALNKIFNTTTNILIQFKSKNIIKMWKNMSKNTKKYDWV